jgi:hypothetical protein
MRAVMAEDITLLLSKMIRAYYGFRCHRTRRTIFMVGTGSAVSPCYLLLVCAKLMTRPFRRSHHPLTVQSFPVSRQAWFSDRACFGRLFLGHIRQRSPDAPTSVSVHRDFHTYSPFGRVWDANMSAPILRCRIFRVCSRLIIAMDPTLHLLLRDLEVEASTGLKKERRLKTVRSL